MPKQKLPQTPEKTDNLLTYLRWRGDLTFAAAPFCEVDNLVLAMDCYLNYEGLIPASFSEEPVLLSSAVNGYLHKSEKEQHLGLIIPTDIRALAKATAASARFTGTKVVGYRNMIDESVQMQFCALTYLLPDDSIYIAFRGTDDTIVGWKEDFMLAFISPVPAQARAVAYLNEVAQAFPGRPIRVGGHSKGGNLSHYAAVYAEPQAQAAILCAYSNDGPGFMPEFFQEPGYAAVERRLVSLVPQSSIVGVLLHHSNRFRVIHSTQRTIMQHDPFSWSVCGPKFVAERSRSDFGIRADIALDHWLDSMSMRERTAFAECVFKVISASGAKTLTEMLEDKVNNLKLILRSFTRLKREDRDLVFDIIRRLLRAGRDVSPMPAPMLSADEMISRQKAAALGTRKSKAARKTAKNKSGAVKTAPEKSKARVEKNAPDDIKSEKTP